MGCGHFNSIHQLLLQFDSIVSWKEVFPPIQGLSLQGWEEERLEAGDGLSQCPELISSQDPCFIHSCIFYVNTQDSQFCCPNQKPPGHSKSVFCLVWRAGLGLSLSTLHLLFLRWDSWYALAAFPWHGPCLGCPAALASFLPAFTSESSHSDFCQGEELIKFTTMVKIQQRFC